MGRILALTEEQHKLNDELYFLDETSETYKEEFESLMSKQLANNKSMTDILAYLSDVLLESKAESVAKREVARSTQKRAITAENKFGNLKEYIHGVMIANNISKVEGKFGALSLRKGTMTAFIPESFDLSSLPEFLVSHEPETWSPRKNEIKKYLKSGEEIDGIVLLESEKTLTVS